MTSTMHGTTPGQGTPMPGEKTIATVKAQLAIRGFQTHDTVTGGWLVCRWNMSHYCPHLADLKAFLSRVGGAA